jgi:hypothetical protein
MTTDNGECFNINEIPPIVRDRTINYLSIYVDKNIFAKNFGK